MIYAVRNCENGNFTYIRAKSGHEAIRLFLKGINKRATIVVYENFYYTIVDGITYSAKNGDD